MPRPKHEATLPEIVLAGLGALATSSEERFETFKSKGTSVLEKPVRLRGKVVGRHRGDTFPREVIGEVRSLHDWAVGILGVTVGRVEVLDHEVVVESVAERQMLRRASSESFVAEQRFPELVEAMMPAAVPTPAMVLQARRNAEARTALIEEFGLLTSSQIAEINESAAGNRAALASRWKREGKILSVVHRGAVYYPAFQFDSDGRPRPVVARVLAALGDNEGWDTALWFIAANGYLEGTRPIDLLDSGTEAVIAAAEQAGEVPY